jgi:hypothetical protein
MSSAEQLCSRQEAPDCPFKPETVSSTNWRDSVCFSAFATSRLDLRCCSMGAGFDAFIKPKGPCHAPQIGCLWLARLEERQAGGQRIQLQLA